MCKIISRTDLVPSRCFWFSYKEKQIVKKDKMRMLHLHVEPFRLDRLPVTLTAQSKPWLLNS